MTKITKNTGTDPVALLRIVAERIDKASGSPLFTALEQKYLQASVDLHTQPEPEPYSLAYYTELVKGRTEEENTAALDDIRQALAIWHARKPITDPYIAKLLAERDAILTHYADRKRHLENVDKGGLAFWTAQVAEQDKWIERHGGSLDAYIERYGSIDDPDHYGHGGEAIWEADNSHLAYLRERVRENS